MKTNKRLSSKPKPNAATLRRLTKYNTNSDGACSPALTVAQFGDYSAESLELLRSIIDLLKLVANGSPYPNSDEAQQVIATQRETINNQAEQINNLTKQRDSARASLAANIQNLGESRALVLQLTEKLGGVTLEHDKMAGQLLTAKRMLAGFRTENTSSPFGEEG